jgi:UDP-N-acetylglucosamine 2-epimerase (non-hydrolysing)
VKRYIAILGTRPEAIKLAPIILGAKNHQDVTVELCSTGQHKEMLDQALLAFELTPDYDLSLMTSNQALSEFHAIAVSGIHRVLSNSDFDGVIVQGDTATAVAGAIAGFHANLPVIHVEAGLRTWDLSNPFPEEGNRTIIDSLATVNAAPTAQAAENLKKMGIPESNIFVTGNTAIDALLYMKSKIDSSAQESSSSTDVMEFGSVNLKSGSRIIAVTGHRRESFGRELEQICRAIGAIAASHPDVQIVYPVHLNPNVQEPVYRILGKIDNIHLCDPMSYPDFVNLLANSYLVLTDSGGIQEEAPALDLPVLVMRKTTERPEGVNAGCARLVGVSEKSIIDGVAEILGSDQIHQSMATAINPYGDGHAATRILDRLADLVPGKLP